MEDEIITPTGEINADLSGNTEINLTTKSVTPGLNRQDKSVKITDENGNVQKSSSIMMGYNKQGIVLGDGSFISEEDVKKAIQEELARQEPGTVIVNRHTLAEINFTEFFNIIKSAAGAIIVGERNPKITNQDSRNWGVLGNNGETVSKGVAFLGNKGVQLKPGVYVNLEEVKKAMEDYVFAKKEPKKVTPHGKGLNNEEREDKIVARVVKRHKISLVPLLLSLIMLVSGMIHITDDIKKEVRQHIVEKEQTVQVVDYDINEQRRMLEDSDEAVERIMEEITMGKKLPVRDGQEFNVNSLETGSSKTMGEEFTLEGKEAGDYQVTGFSIVVNGEIIEFKEDFNGLDNQTKLKDFIEDTLKKHNLTVDEIEVKLHLGVNGDYTRLGWIDITDLINKDTITKDMLQEKVKDVCVDKGVINDFTGETITLPDGTTIKVVDNNGDFLKSGTKVIGSDNKEYTIEKMEVEEVTKKVITEENVVEEVVVGKKIVWQINNLALGASLLPAIFVAANAIRSHIKNKKNNKEPNLYEFENEKQYKEFKVEFKRAKNKYEKGSKFGRLMKRVFLGKRVDIMQRLTNEQVQEIYAAIKRHAGRDFVLGPNDKIKMKEGKIYIYYADEHVLDITDIIMADIATIGSHNFPDAEGYLDKDKDKDGKIDENDRKRGF